MKHIRLAYLLIALLSFWSCLDDWSFSRSTRYTLAFSADTVRFDTVFTDVVSASDGFMIYNPNDEGIAGLSGSGE